jgi:hypothetical protein
MGDPAYEAIRGVVDSNMVTPASLFTISDNVALLAVS